MKNFCILFLLVLLSFSCEEEKKVQNLKASSGKINSLSIIINNQMWNGEVGDSLRNKFAAPVDGLPQQEPLFNISQYDPKLFEGFMTNSRSIVIVSKAETNQFEIKQNVYAQPQKVIYISGQNISDIVQLIEEHSKEITTSLKESEIAENQRRIKISKLDVEKIKKKFNATINMPSAYKYIIVDEKFFWIRKELPSGNTSILIYEVPINAIENDSAIVSNIIQMRDTIGKKHIEGTLPNTFMVTEQSYAPYLFEITLDGKKTYETKGTWELKNDFMAGPFINYAIKDEKNNRFLVIEGFCYNPSTSKRDLMFELEAIIKSVKILK